MRLRVDCIIGRTELVWATWYLTGHKGPFPSKERVLEFLRHQLSQFRTEMLMGESAEDDMDGDPEGVRYATQKVARWWPEDLS